MRSQKDCCDEARKLSVENMKMAYELGIEAEHADRMQGRIWALESELEKAKGLIDEVQVALELIQRTVDTLSYYGQPKFDEDNIWAHQSWQDMAWEGKEKVMELMDAISAYKGDVDG